MHSSRHARSSARVIPVSAASRSADASASMSGGSPSRSRDFCGNQCLSSWRMQLSPAHSQAQRMSRVEHNLSASNCISETCVEPVTIAAGQRLYPQNIWDQQSRCSAGTAAAGEGRAPHHGFHQLLADKGVQLPHERGAVCQVLRLLPGRQHLRIGVGAQLREPCA